MSSKDVIWPLLLGGVLCILAGFYGIDNFQSLLFLFLLFIVFVIVILELLARNKQYNEKLYLATVAIVLFLSTIIYSILTSPNGLTNFVTYIPFIVGFLLAIKVAPGLKFVKLMNEAVILMNKKKFPEALNKFDRALELVSKNTDYAARLNRAIVLHNIEKI